MFRPIDWSPDQSASFEEVVAWGVGVVYVCDGQKTRMMATDEVSRDAALVSWHDTEGFSWWKTSFCSPRDWLQQEFDLPTGSAGHSVCWSDRLRSFQDRWWQTVVLSNQLSNIFLKRLLFSKQFALSFPKMVVCNNHQAQSGYDLNLRIKLCHI